MFIVCDPVVTVKKTRFPRTALKHIVPVVAIQLKILISIVCSDFT